MAAIGLRLGAAIIITLNTLSNFLMVSCWGKVYKCVLLQYHQSEP